MQPIAQFLIALGGIFLLNIIPFVLIDRFGIKGPAFSHLAVQRVQGS